MATVIKSVSMSLELHNLMKNYAISPSEAIRVGACVLLSDCGEPQYMNKLNVGRKLQGMVNQIKEIQEKLNKYEVADVLEIKE